MADGDKKTYPYIANKNWWELRRRFQASPPSKVTSTYLESMLKLGNEKTAQNLLAQLRTLGLVDEDERLTELAHSWRHDEDYPAACKTMLETLYPEELRDAVPPPAPDRDAATKWFAKTMKSGTVVAAQKAAFYALLAAGDPTAANEAPTRPGATTATSAARRPRPAAAIQAPAARAGNREEPAAAAPRPPDSIPTVHIDVQVHISAEASAEQIDQVFASMAKHLYKR